jgi:hypothetical protein
MILPVQFMKRMVPERWRPRFHFITRNVPRHWWYLTNDRRLWWFTGVADEIKNRNNLVRHELQEGCFLETCWIDRTGPDGNRECGPAIFLVVHGSEIMKFDCYGYPSGHYHVATPYPHGIRKGLTGRILLPEKTREEQVDRAIFELQRNGQYYLQTHPRRKVRSTRLDGRRMAAICAEMRARLREDVKRLTNKERDHAAAAGSNDRRADLLTL